MTPNEADPRGLIRESYRIAGVSAAECRAILLDWALSLPEGVDTSAALRLLIDRYGRPGHPMTAILQEGLASPPKSRRRGGRAGRRGRGGD